ncbi:MAG: hypothetical protein ACO1N0_07955 [Fluviicola sp.]
MKAPIILIVLILLATSSCTVQKRLYNRGFHVEFRKSIKGSVKEPLLPSFDEENNMESEVFPDDSVQLDLAFEKTISDDLIQNEVIPEQNRRGNSLNLEKPVLTTRFSGRSHSFVSTRFTSVAEITSSSKDNFSLKESTSQEKTGTPKRDVNWEKIIVRTIIWLLVAALIVLILLSPFAKYFLIAVCVVAAGMLLGWLISCCFSGFEWFWSGR